MVVTVRIDAIMKVVVAVALVIGVAVSAHRGGQIGATLRIECGLDGDESRPERGEQCLDRRIAPQPQPVRQDLNRHVTVAEMPRQSRKRFETSGPRLDQGLGLGDHLDEAAALEHQEVSHAQRHWRGQIELVVGAADAHHKTALRPARLEGQDSRVDDAAAIGKFGGKDTGDAGHGRFRTQ